MKTDRKEKKERVIPKMIGSMSRSAKVLYRNFPKSVQRMVQEVEHNAKYLEYAVMGYDVQIDSRGIPFKPKGK